MALAVKEALMERKGVWLSVLDYAQYRKISISTVRRYIKANRVEHRSNEGRYEIFVSEEKLSHRAEKEDEELLKLKLENEELKQRVRKLTEANNDMKMLIQIYEGQASEELPSPPSLKENSESKEIQ